MAKKSNDKIKKLVQRVFAEAGRKILNYKQVAKKLDIDSSEGKNEVLLVMKQWKIWCAIIQGVMPNVVN